MEFRLVYQGSLPAASQGNTRSKDKHVIRQVFHPQLRELWQQHPTLVRINRKHSGSEPDLIDSLPDRYNRCGYRFLPLVSDFFNLTCALDILFLRRDQPGGLVRHGGDIDNRLKVLLDALRIPSPDELGQNTPTANENPFYCLLEDDRLITELKVTTDLLLTQPTESVGQSNVHLIVQVRTTARNSATGGIIF